MYALIGEQQVDPVAPDEQREQFGHMADIVQQTRGFIRGSWGLDADDPQLIRAFIVLDSRENALALKSAVEERVPDSRLRLMEIQVEAGV
jgi:hypothetical protein